MKVLYIAHRVPYPPNKGDKIRAFHELKALSEHHRIHLLALADQAEDVEAAPALREFCREVEVFPISAVGGKLRCALGMAGSRPLTHAYYWSAALDRRVRELAASGGFDAVIAYTSSVAPYAASFQEVPRLLDMVDLDSAKWEQYARRSALAERWIYALEARRLRKYEVSLAGDFDEVVVATSEELRLLHDITPDLQAAAVCNGVDLGYFHPFELPKASNPTLIFTGQMDYFANVDGVVHFARTVFRRLRTRFRDLEFLIVGRSPAAQVRALESIPGVMVTGTVGDVRPFLARSWVFVAPLRIAQGIQNKILEAMASGLPVICSERCLAGLLDGGFRLERDLMAARGAEEWEAAIGRLVEDPALRASMGASACQQVASSYSWSRNMQGFEQALRRAVSQFRARRHLDPTDSILRQHYPREARSA